MKSAKTGGVNYLDTCQRSGPYPVPIGICFDAKAWKSEMKRLGVDGEDEFYAYTDHHRRIVNPCGSIRCYLCFPKITELSHAFDQIEAIAHEATHAWQSIRDHINERTPAHEQEAYMVGWITAWALKQVYEAGLLKRVTRHP
jgi:hypothetical protein